MGMSGGPVVLGCLALLWIAAVPVKPASAEEELLIDDCESAELWPGLKTSTEKKTQGKASLRWDYSVSKEWSLRNRKVPNPIDLSGYTAVEFDMYLESDATDGTFGLLFKAADGLIVDPYLQVEGAQNKWTHMDIPIPDKFKVVEIALAVPGYRVKGSGKVIVYLDNVKATHLLPRDDSAAQVLAASKDYSVWFEWATTKVPKGRALEPGKEKIDSVVRVSAARDEYEPFQIVVRPRGEKGLKNVEIAFSDLEAKDGAKIDKSAIKYNPVHYFHVPDRYKVDFSVRENWIPDLLRNVRRFDAPNQENYPVWCTLKVPKGVPGGKYCGEATIKADDVEPAVVKLELTVWDFDLPPETHVGTSFSAHIGATYQMPEKRRFEKRTKEEAARDYYRNYAEHRFGTCIEVVSWRGPDLENAEKWFSYALDECRMPWTWFPVDRFNYHGDEKIEELCRAYAPLFKKRGWMNKCFFYLADEPTPEQYTRVKSSAAAVRRADPDIKRLPATAGILPELYGAVDIWCPVIQYYSPSLAAERKKLGEEVWWYEVDEKYPYPVTKLAHRAVEPRALFWIMWKYGIAGFLVWDSTCWANPKGLPADDPWTIIGPCGGTGTYLYPDKDNDYKGICNTIRWELLREGIEDYEYHWLLRKAIGDLKKLGEKHAALIAQSEAVLASCDGFIVSPLNCARIGARDLYEAREKIALQIVKIRKALAGE